MKQNYTWTFSTILVVKTHVSVEIRISAITAVRCCAAKELAETCLDEGRRVAKKCNFLLHLERLCSLMDIFLDDQRERHLEVVTKRT